MIRSSGLLSFNSSMNGGKLVQPHVQKRKISEILSSNDLKDIMYDFIHVLACLYLFIYVGRV